jgi:hypothetical protein
MSGGAFGAKRGGKSIRGIKRNGSDVAAMLTRGKPGYIKSPNGLGLDGLIPTEIRTVEDGGKTWMEVGIVIHNSTPLTGNPTDGWAMHDGYGYIYLEWRRRLTQWEPGIFVAAPSPLESRTGETVYWSRSIHPVTAPTGTAAELVCESTLASRDSRNNPVTGFEVAGVAVSLPNFPYTFPEDAAQLQTDLRAAGYTAAEVTASSGLIWKIVLKNLTFGTDQSARIRFAPYFVGYVLGFPMGRSSLYFRGAVLDDDGVEIALEGFARVGVLPGARYGYPTLNIPDPGQLLPVTDPDPLDGLESFTAEPDRTLWKPYLTYPLAEITGDATPPGSTLTRPAYVWDDPGWDYLTIVGTWYKNGVATANHGAAFTDWGIGDFITYKEIATNENGSSFENNYAWKTWFIVDDYYAYSLDRVATLFSAMTGPAIFAGGSLDRAQSSVFPHACFTGHAFGGGWADAGGLRFTAVTKRHMVGCAHYGYGVGQVVKFKTVDNQIVTRTIQELWRPQIAAAYNSFISDFQVFLLDADLPTTIRPVPVVGDWYRRFLNVDANTFIKVNQSANLIMWNNSGHATPGRLCDTFANTYGNTPVHVIDTLSVEPKKTQGFPEPGPLVLAGYESLDYSNLSAEFYHHRYYGDSGSPVFAPVSEAAGLWALSGIVSGSMWTPSAMNEAIGRVDNKAGISTGYTVTVAPDPTS